MNLKEHNFLDFFFVEIIVIIIHILSTTKRKIIDNGEINEYLENHHRPTISISIPSSTESS